MLLGQGARIGLKASDGATALHLAAEAGRADVVTLLIDHGASVSALDQMKHTPFTIALVSGHLEIADKLLRLGADVNQRTEPFSVTPVMWAALSGRVNQVDFLIRSGSDVQARDARGQTPLHHAVVGAVAGVVKTEWDERGNSIVLEKPGNVEQVVKRLLSAGADARVKDNDGMSPSDWAKKGRLHEIGGLLEIGGT